MTVKKKRLLIITCLCALFLAAAGVTFLALNDWNLFPPESGTEPASKISFPQNTASAHAEFQNIAMDGYQWYRIVMDFPDEESAKELYKTEEWANNYQYDKELRLAPWVLTASYQQKDGGTVTRRYQKSDWDEVLADFIKTHEQYITEKTRDMPEESAQ